MPEQPTTKSKKYGPRLVLGSAALVAFLAVWEGGKTNDGGSVVYRDKLAGGLPTVCNGITKHVTTTPIVVGEFWPQSKCEAEEHRALIKMQENLEKCFATRPPQSVFDMASSHAWNLGWPATCGSQAMKAWRFGDWVTGCKRLAFSDSGERVWSYVRTGKLLPDGTPERKFIQGLANRREAEYEDCLADALQPEVTEP